MKPTDKLRALKSDTALSRLHYCYVMLDVHGFLTDAESDRIWKRIKRWAEDARHEQAKAKRKD